MPVTKTNNKKDLKLKNYKACELFLSTQNFCSELHQPLLNSNFWHGHKGPFLFNKKSSLTFEKFHVLNGTVHSGCTDQTKAIARLVIVLVSRMPKSGTGDNQRKLSNGKGHLV